VKVCCDVRTVYMRRKCSDALYVRVICYTECCKYCYSTALLLLAVVVVADGSRLKYSTLSVGDT
jgi:hypothetical protein